LHEPFASLLSKNPKVGLRLITNLTNHATTGWRQVHKFRPQERGTPMPVVLEFSWGRQEFWGDWHVYGWGLGMLGFELLQCAYLAPAYTYQQLTADIGGLPILGPFKSRVFGAGPQIGYLSRSETCHAGIFESQGLQGV
jgi:hypothetical protein